MQTHLICPECPNGCNLSLDWKDAASVVISDNQCNRGIGYAARMLRKEQDVRVEAKERTTQFSQEAVAQVVKNWDMDLARLRYDISVQGSPERSLFRVVVESATKELFVLEQIAIKHLDAKRRIAQTLDLLSQKKIGQLNPYLQNRFREHLVQHKATFWQIAPFVPGVALDRKRYIFDAWRGAELAEFLIALRQAGDVPFFDTKKVFSLKDYIQKLSRSIALYQGDVKARVEDVQRYLDKDLMPVYERLPVVFCHGDYHPMNMIWKEDRIACVIDWEFAGYKTELYDAANLIGCVGVEDPQALFGGLLASFMRTLDEAKIVSDLSWHHLVDLVIALRFAWLSEWLRRDDRDMIDLELDYMHVLMDNKKDLAAHWGLGRKK